MLPLTSLLRVMRRLPRTRMPREVRMEARLITRTICLAETLCTILL